MAAIDVLLTPCDIVTQDYKENVIETRFEIIHSVLEIVRFSRCPPIVDVVLIYHVTTTNMYGNYTTNTINIYES